MLFLTLIVKHNYLIAIRCVTRVRPIQHTGPIMIVDLEEGLRAETSS